MTSARRAVVIVLMFALASGQAAGQAPFDSLGLAFRCGQPGQTCLNHRVLLAASGAVRIDRSDGITVRIHFADSIVASLRQEFMAIGIGVLPDTFPNSAADCAVYRTHSPGVTFDLFRPGLRRRIEDRRGCGLDEDKFGVDRANAVRRLQRFEDRIQWSLGVEQWVDPPTIPALIARIRKIASADPALSDLIVISDTTSLYEEFIRRRADGRDSIMIAGKHVLFPFIEYFHGDTAMVDLRIKRPAQHVETGAPYVDTAGTRQWRFIYAGGAWAGTPVRPPSN